MLSEFIDKNRLPDSFADTVKNYYLPLATNIVAKAKRHNSPYFVGVNGCQGSGKSTLVDYLAQELMNTHQLNVVVMSLDDFYLAKKQRQDLAQAVHPLFKTRGVPGTHNTSALSDVITHLKNHQVDFQIPRFDKSQDDPFPNHIWPTIKSATDIVLIEGWCWGITSQLETALEPAVNELERDFDNNGIWRKYVNEQIKNNYEPLYQCIDFWVVLNAPSFDCVYQWRLEQEQKLIDKTKDSERVGLMSPQQINEFIQYFQRLTEHGLRTLGDTADVTFSLNSTRNISSIQLKGSL